MRGWHEIDGVWHYCSRHHPGMGMAVVWTPFCEDASAKTVTDGRGDVWCRRCMAYDAKVASC